MSSSLPVSSSDPYVIPVRRVFVNAAGQEVSSAQDLLLGERMEGLFQNGYGMSDVMNVFILLMTNGRLMLDFEEQTEKLELVDQLQVISKEAATLVFEQVAQRCFTNHSGGIEATQKIKKVFKK